jgi:XTP/dITP diphosphohydrolase
VKLVVATRNEGKWREIEVLLQGLGAEVVGLGDYPDAPEADEPYDTFAQNAAQKALLTARYTGEWAVADDSGLVVDALEGAPGVKSSRVAADDTARVQWLLERMADVPEGERSARFVCAIVLASPEGVIWQGEGTVEGTITREPSGEGGFGFDPVFLHVPAGKTFAQLSREEKSAVSHRGKALQALRLRLAELKA